MSGMERISVDKVLGTGDSGRRQDGTLVVSVHDVHQHNSEDVSRILCQLEDVGVPKCSLLVVPDFHGHGPMSNDTDFCSWLYSLERRGYEIVAHGYRHLDTPRQGRSLRDRLMTRIYTRGEGEFYDLSEFEAEEALRRSRSVFRTAGVAVRGFIAPAWLLSEGARRAARRMGFEYTTRLCSIVDLCTGRETRGRSFVYSTGNTLRRSCSLALNGLLKQTLANAPLQRVGIHPPDALHETIWEQELAIIRQAAAKRRIMTYMEWVAAERKAAA